jgi:hypothetical protein
MSLSLVMPGLVPGIHVLNHDKLKDVDGRDKPGHDAAYVPGATTRRSARSR